MKSVAPRVTPLTARTAQNQPGTVPIDEKLLWSFACAAACFFAASAAVASALSASRCAAIWSKRLPTTLAAALIAVERSVTGSTVGTVGMA